MSLLWILLAVSITVLTANALPDGYAVMPAGGKYKVQSGSEGIDRQKVQESVDEETTTMMPAGAKVLQALDGAVDEGKTKEGETIPKTKAKEGRITAAQKK